MANLRETATWEAGIYQWETSDPVMGGENGIDNLPTRQLANRTVWLKTELAKAVASIGANQTSMGNITLSAGAGLTGGGNLTANRSFTLATPSTLSGSTDNWAGNGATGHTHKLAAATTQVAGVVKLVDNLSTDDSSTALSAKQGKNLLDALKSMGYDNLDKGAASRTGIDLNTLTTHGSVTYVNYAGAHIAKTLPEWWQKYNLPSAETQWGVVLVYRESATIVYQLFLTALGQVWFRFRSIANPSSPFNKRGWVRLDGAEWSDIRGKPDFALANSVVNLSAAQDITGEKTFKYQIKLQNVVGGVKHGARFGTNSNDTFVQNETSGKYLQLKNDGSLQYDSKKVFHEGHLPTWAQVNNKPTTLAGYGVQNEIIDLINAAIPAGFVGHFSGERPPKGWLVRNGAAISRTTYAALFAVLGTRHGAGDGSTTFNLPDDRGIFDRSWDGGRGVDAGREFGSWQEQSTQWHYHGMGMITDGNDDAHFIRRDWGWGASTAQAVLGDSNRVMHVTIGNGNLGTTDALIIGGSTHPTNRAWLPIIKA